MVRFLLTICACFAGYLLLAGSVSASECMTAAALGIVAAVWSVVLRRTSGEDFAFTPAHLRVWLRAGGAAPGAALHTASALVRAVLGAEPWRAEERAFRQGRLDSPDERARRATAVLAASFAPAGFVVRIEQGRGTVLIHGVDRAPPPERTEWLA